MRLFKRDTTDTMEVTLGCPVFTSDNENLGYVKEIRSDAFKIDVAMGRDYWLSRNHVRRANDTELIVDFPKGQLDQYRLSDTTELEESHVAPIQNEFFTQARGSIITDEEQMQVRENMERELAEQRQKLHEN